MNLKKKAQCVMLPTDKAEGCLLKGLGTLQRFPDKYFTQEYLIETKRTSHHLYIVDDSEIKEGDWCLAVLTNTLFQVKEIDSSTREIYYLQFGILCPKRNAKKVIASTDKSLDLPSSSEQFIQKYVESYNKGNVISEVNIDYQEYYMSNIGDKFIVNKDLYGLSKGTSLTIKSFNFKNDPNLIEFEEDDEHNQGIHITHTNIKTEFLLKVDSKNQVTITRCKESYSKEEVTELFEKFVDQKYPLLYPFLKENL